MFSRKDMSVGDWWLFYLLMIIPFVNILFYVIILFSSSTNKSLKNYLLASLIPIVFLLVIIFGTGFFAVFTDSM